MRREREETCFSLTVIKCSVLQKLRKLATSFFTPRASP
jgi:hypothetical protein